MRPKERRESGQSDLFRARLDQIVDLDHPVVKLARRSTGAFSRSSFGAVYTDVPGRPPLPTRLMAGLAILKHMHDLSDEVLMRALGREPVLSAVLRRGVLSAPASVRPLVADALAPAHGRGEARRAHPGEPVRRDAHGRGQARGLYPGDHRHDRAGEGDRLSDRRQADASRARAPGAARQATGRRPAPILRAGRQDRADQPPALRPRQAVQAGEPRRCASIRTMLGRVDPRHHPQDRGNDRNWRMCSRCRSRGSRGSSDQRQRQRGRKVYSLHAPEVECIGKGKAHKPYEFGVKCRVATPLNRCRGGQFVAHVKALPGNPYDGHTLAPSSRTSRNRSARASNASSPIGAIAATTRRQRIASGSISRVKKGASPRPSNANCGAALPSSPSSVISRPTTEWAEIISPMRLATPSTPCSPPSATTSAGCWSGWRFCCLSSRSRFETSVRQISAQSPPDRRSSRATR